VDVPTGVELNYFAYFNFPFFDQNPLEKMPGTPADAKKMAEEKVRELKAKPHDIKGSSYIRSLPLANGGILVQGWSVGFSVRNIDTFLYIPVSTRGKSFVYTYQVWIAPEYEQKMLQDLVTFGSSFHPLAEGVIPKEEGLCLEDVMLRKLPDSIMEYVAVNFEDPHAKGLIICFKTMHTLSKIPWLTKDPGWAEEKCRRLGGSKKCDQLRFGKHPVGSIMGEEICVAGNTYDGRYRTYDFDWNNPGIKNSKTSPRLDATLIYKGVPRQYSTAPTPFSSDAEALAVWDRFVNSIRPRFVESIPSAPPTFRSNE
jgi:hypothetical protein